MYSFRLFLIVFNMASMPLNTFLKIWVIRFLMKYSNVKEKSVNNLKVSDSVIYWMLPKFSFRINDENTAAVL